MTRITQMGNISCKRGGLDYPVVSGSDNEPGHRITPVDSGELPSKPFNFIFPCVEIHITAQAA